MLVAYLVKVIKLFAAVFAVSRFGVSLRLGHLLGGLGRSSCRRLVRASPILCSLFSNRSKNFLGFGLCGSRDRSPGRSTCYNSGIGLVVGRSPAHVRRNNSIALLKNLPLQFVDFLACRCLGSRNRCSRR